LERSRRGASFGPGPCLSPRSVCRLAASERSIRWFFVSRASTLDRGLSDFGALDSSRRDASTWESRFSLRRRNLDEIRRITNRSYRNKKRRCGAFRCVFRAPPFRRPAAADSAPRRPEGAVSFLLWAATSPKAVAVQVPRKNAVSIAVSFHFSVVGAKRGGGPAGRGACRSERAGWPARQAVDLRPHRPSRDPLPFTRSSMSGFRDANRRMYLIVDAHGVSLIM
jgi:hypothetical protein